MMSNIVKPILCVCVRVFQQIISSLSYTARDQKKMKINDLNKNKKKK